MKVKFSEEERTNISCIKGAPGQDRCNWFFWSSGDRKARRLVKELLGQAKGGETEGILEIRKKHRTNKELG